MNRFTFFQSDISDFSLPEKFTYPFNYTPHPLAIRASEELKQYIQLEIEPVHNFGLDKNPQGIGKMFGVLVVMNQNGKLGYISAFSGKLGMKNHYEKFVPPVYDMLANGEFYKEEEEKINIQSAKINLLENDASYMENQSLLANTEVLCAQELSEFKEKKRSAKDLREHQRRQILEQDNSSHSTEMLKELDRESARWHYELKHLTTKWKLKIANLTALIESHKELIVQEKRKRKDMSVALQHRLFENYTFLNAKKEKSSLHAIFPIDSGELPPSGAGECAAPKLLHYAYKHDLRPICLAEFWYGRSPSSEIRKHGYYYPACKTKCLPILTHMLRGLDVDDNPLEDNPMKMAHLDIVYDDADIVVVNKPHDFLSVPGKTINDSIFTRLQLHYPLIKELMVVHRLDMSTSGLILFAKNKAAHKHIQMQFLHKTIRKKYVAILEGELALTRGSIDLPIAVDYEHRPRQKVCYEHGKPAVTNFDVVKVAKGKTLIHFYPIGGRTHQLRVHAAHSLGLNAPILGDDLYGIRADRLYLHAEELCLIHPSTNKELEFQVASGFEVKGEV